MEADVGGGEVSRGRRDWASRRVTRSFVNRLLRMTLLAPDIQEVMLTPWRAFSSVAQWPLLLRIGVALRLRFLLAS